MHQIVFTSNDTMEEQERRHKRALYDRRRREQMTPDQRQNENNRNKRRRQSSTPQEVENRNIIQRQYRRRRLTLNIDLRTESNFRRRRIPPPTTFVARDSSIRPQQNDIGLKNIRCSDCGALHFAAEKTCRGKFSTCCASGSIRLPALTTFPQQFHSWLTEDTVDGKNFRVNIRKYNGSFAFASFGYQTVGFSSGPHAFVIHGQVYHRTAKTLNSSENVYAQLYILDPEFATQKRCENEHNSGCYRSIFEAIDFILRRNNPFAGAYSMMKEVMQNMGEESTSINMWIIKDRTHDPRRYNLPVANEVAAVFVSDDGEPPFDRDIAVHPKGDHNLQNLSILSPNCDPMTYPLLFPHGDPGWQRGIDKVGKNKDAHNANSDNDDGDEEKTRKVSMLEFYSYHLQERQSFNPLLSSGKLSQQYIVDAFLKVEGQRLQWSRMNQKKLRVDLYMGLMDYVNSRAERQDLKAGRIVILPSSFTGGKRYMQQNYQDAMILVAKFGKPDLFVTFTCNPKWKEITSNLKPTETALDRPDLVATVFYLKLKEFMNDMTCNRGGVLGKVVAFMSVIEFQKRGIKIEYTLNGFIV